MQFYNEEEAKKYFQKAVELLNLPEDQPCFLLDVGFFPCLLVGFSGSLPKGLGSETVDRSVPNQVQFTGQRSRFKNMKGKSAEKGKDWILEGRRRQGREVRADTKYTARQRRPHFSTPVSPVCSDLEIHPNGILLSCGQKLTPL
ncbi:18S rRNA (guanine-N(7))-methyltransferase-like [Salvelinus alpinus]|uniref:18S rRNA (guanine-N(7))-methyltransferase-like n=1 Tax=Salvelinus alpinus TaxID=8036 RepID=UPI0039FCDFD5